MKRVRDRITSTHLSIYASKNYDNDLSNCIGYALSRY